MPILYEKRDRVAYITINNPAKANIFDKETADAISEGLKKGDTSEKQLRSWETAFVTGMQRMRRLVCEFYDGFSFGRFVKKYPHLKDRVTDVLIGDVFDDKVDLLWPLMDEMRTERTAAR